MSTPDFVDAAPYGVVSYLPYMLEQTGTDPRLPCSTFS